MRSGLQSGPAPTFLAHSVLGFLVGGDRAWLFMYPERTVIVWKGEEFGVGQAPASLVAAARVALSNLQGGGL